MSVFHIAILMVIIVVGTFALALSYAGNDLVNFIGVPIAAWQSFGDWHRAFLSTGVAPSDFLMTDLGGAVPPPTFLLLASGVVMVLTLWFNKQTQTVAQTGVDLARQGDGDEKFKPNQLSRIIVRYSIVATDVAGFFFPKRLREKIDKKFQKPDTVLNDRRIDAPAFDSIRASVNLVVASILISIGTNMKIPLSTTYVTFMVAMGTSLSDRAWDRESAVYRVAGVLNVIGGWIATAFFAFIGAAVVAALIWYGKMTAVIILTLVTGGLIVRNAILHSRKIKAQK